MGSLQTLRAAAAGAAALVSIRRRRPRLGSGRAGGAPRRRGLDSGRGGDCSSPTWRPREGARQDGGAHQPGTRGTRSLRAPRPARGPSSSAIGGRGPSISYRGGVPPFLRRCGGDSVLGVGHPRCSAVRRLGRPRGALTSLIQRLSVGWTGWDNKGRALFTPLSKTPLLSK